MGVGEISGVVEVKMRERVERECDERFGGVGKI